MTNIQIFLLIQKEVTDYDICDGLLSAMGDYQAWESLERIADLNNIPTTWEEEDHYSIIGQSLLETMDIKDIMVALLDWFSESDLADALDLIACQNDVEIFGGY